MNPEIERILATEADLQKRVDELAAQLLADYRDKNPMFIGILSSCYVFMADIIRRFDAPCTVDFLAISRYGPDRDNLILSRDVGTAPMGRNVVVLEALLDTGRTMCFVTDLLRNRGTRTLEVCTLLDQPSGRLTEMEAKYVGFTIPSGKVVGYGLDDQEQLRNLPYVGLLKERAETERK
jgi:hypoxanthine phosphoribosyltransferase